MGIPSTTAANLEEQARNYRVITDIVLNNDNCPSLLIWGIKDNDSWREGVNPLLYDSGLGKKKAWYAVRSALRHRCIQQEKLGTDDPETDPNTHSHRSKPHVYTTKGTKLGTMEIWPELPQGVYIVEGKLKMK